jgi:hypothetical protein
LHELLGCESGAKEDAERVARVREAQPGPVQLHQGRLHYRALWKLWGLTVADTDIRFSYGNPAYGSDDATQSPMAVGYIGRYWNAYFDGSATIDELVSYLLVEELAKRAPAIATLLATGALKENSLTRKYSHLRERYAFDETFFWSVDTRAPWIPIPYPKVLEKAHHRQGFPAELATQHRALCDALRGVEASSAHAPTGATGGTKP